MKKVAMPPVLIGVMLLTVAVISEAQQAYKAPRVGFLVPVSAAEIAPVVEAFRQGLRELGYVEGKNIMLEVRGGAAQLSRLDDLADELVRLNVAVIVAGANPAIRAAKKATSTIPIVMRTGSDPVKSGLVDNLVRPSGNITGIVSREFWLGGKRLELLREVVPEVKRVAVLTADRNPKATEWYQEIEAGSQAAGIKLAILNAREPSEIDTAFVAMAKEGINALVVIPHYSYVQHGERILKHAEKNRLPAIYSVRILVENGGLMSYGANVADEFRRSAVYVDKILKGAKPADLPVEHAEKLDLAINVKTARALGLKIPAHLLMQADRVIE
jgi:putative ABC transport system substrate-binding protein